MKVKSESVSCVWLFEPPWAVAQQAPLSMEVSRQECWNVLPFASPGDLPDAGTESGSPALTAAFFTFFTLTYLPWWFNTTDLIDLFSSCFLPTLPADPSIYCFLSWADSFYVYTLKNFNFEISFFLFFLVSLSFFKKNLLCFLPVALAKSESE